MREGEAYFFDSYAIAEFNNGNSAFLPYENAVGILTIFNLAELNYAMKRDKKPMADELTRKYSTMLVDVKIEDITRAMDLRMKNKTLSIPDVIGYTVAKRYGVRFLTGDKEFEKMENVEFVK
ncbi:MAG: PIN domain-containing protein [Candidatus Diapherotrites archaeon]|nr:PIN domain-containing protein [Candidatus Diapherotrites archaeon]